MTVFPHLPRSLSAHGRRLLAACALAAASLSAPAAQTVVYPRPESDHDERVSYPIALLRLSLDKSGRSYAMQPSAAHMQQGRSLRFLQQGKVVDVVWTVTSPEREQALLPIRIPIDRGLIGWRLLLIRRQDQAAFAAIADGAALAAKRAGQGHDWPDTEVLRANRYRLSTSTSYEGLFGMLARGHIDYFPRSVSEIWSEVEARPELKLGVADGLALHYPEGLYYFVKRDNLALAQAIETGLRAALADGSMRALFQRYYGAAIQRAGFAARRTIELHNPHLPVAAEPALWFSPAESGGRP